MFAQQINIWSPNWLKPVEKTSPFNTSLFSPESPVNFGSLPSQNTQLNQQLPQAEACVHFKGNLLLVALNNSVFPMAKGSREDCSTGGQRKPKAFNQQKHIHPRLFGGCDKLYKLGIEDLALQTWHQMYAVKYERYRHMVSTQRSDASGYGKQLCRIGSRCSFRMHVYLGLMERPTALMTATSI